jgi:hypothetical protein
MSVIEAHEIAFMLAPSALFGVGAILSKLLFDRSDRAARREI